MNPACRIEEKCFNPSLGDVSSCMDADDPFESWGFSLDVSKAHKRIRVREDERGLLLFGLAGKLYCYKTCHFGAVFSAYWWARTGGCLHRLLHAILWSWHCGWLYVDDWLWRLRRETSPLQAALLALLLCVLGCPIGWHKTALGPSIVWIGFQLHFDTLVVELPPAKVQKIADFLQLVASANRSVERSSLEKGTGLLLWVTSACKIMRPWLCDFYSALATSTPLRLSLTRRQMAQILPLLDAQWVCAGRCPKGPVLPGMRLLAVGNDMPHSADSVLASMSASSKVSTLWRNPRSPKVPATDRLRATASQWRASVLEGRWRFPLGALQQCAGSAAADACAAGTRVGIGGWFTLTDACRVPADAWWFSLSFDVADMPESWSMRPDSQTDIASYELLAQVVLFVLRAQLRPPTRCRVRLSALTDNTPAEGAGNKLFTTAEPLRHVVRCLALWCAALKCEIELDHVQGELNDLADGLSRGKDSAFSSVAASRRLAVSLDDVCRVSHGSRLFPAGEPSVPAALAAAMRS